MSLSSSPHARAALALCAVFALILAVRAGSADAEAFGPQFPISSEDHPSEGLQAAFPDEVFNERTGQYLVVYTGATTAEEDDIYGQLVDPEGNLIGSEIRISTTSREHSAYDPPSVGYDPETGRYLVAWDRDETIHVRLLAPNGAPLTGELPISGSTEDLETQQIAYSPASHEYLIVWKAFNDGRVYSQRLSQDAEEIGADDAAIGGSAALVVDDAVDVVYNPSTSEYMVVFLAAADGGDNEEVYAQRLDLEGAEIGDDDFRISQMGPPGDETNDFVAAPPSIIWNPQRNQYLVGWHGQEGVAPLAPDEQEVYGQLLAADGTEIGPDVRISDVGVDGDEDSNAFRPRLGYDPRGDEYFVAWHADELTPPLVENEYEIYGQYLTAEGAEIGTNDFRITEVLPDGDADFSASRPAVAYNPITCSYLVAYMTGNVKKSESIDSGVFGRQVAASPCAAEPIPGPPRPPRKDLRRR